MWLTSTCLPPARCTAISIARLTSVPTSVRLYSAEPRLSDWGSEATPALSTAAEIAFSVIRCPRNAVSASFDLIGVNPTQPSTIAASLHTSPSIVSRTAALAVGYTGAERLKARYALGARVSHRERSCAANDGGRC